jgi:hypothetical protein
MEGGRANRTHKHEKPDRGATLARRPSQPGAPKRLESTRRRRRRRTIKVPLAGRLLLAFKSNRSAHIRSYSASLRARRRQPDSTDAARLLSRVSSANLGSTNGAERASLFSNYSRPSTGLAHAIQCHAALNHRPLAPVDFTLTTRRSKQTKRQRRARTRIATPAGSRNRY